MGSANTADEGQSFWRTFEPLWIAALGAQFLVLGNLLLPRLIRMIGRGGAVETVEWAIYMSALFVFPVAVWLAGWVLPRVAGARATAIVKRGLALLLAIELAVYAALESTPILVALALLAALLVAGILHGRKRVTPDVVLAFAVGLAGWTAAWGLVYWESANVWIFRAVTTMAAVTAAILLALAIVRGWLRDGSEAQSAPVRVVDLVPLAALVAFSFRTFPVVEHYHWGFFVGPIEQMRQGGTLLWDTPSQYGFLSILVPSLLPGNAWQSFWFFQAAAYAVVACLMYLALKRLAPGAAGAAASFVMTVTVLFFRPRTASLILPAQMTPAAGPVRFIWCFVMLAFLVSWLRNPGRHEGNRRFATTGTVIWVIAVLWSAETAIYVTAMWLPAFLVHTLRRSSGSVRSAVSAVAARVAVSLAAVIVSGALVLGAYRLALLLVRGEGRGVDLLAYFDYVLLYSRGGFGALPIDPAGPIWYLALSFLIVSTILVLHARRDPRDPRLVVWVAAWGCIWAISSYFTGRSHPVNLLALAPLLMFTLAVCLHTRPFSQSGPGRLALAAAIVPVFAMPAALTAGHEEFAAAITEPQLSPSRFTEQVPVMDPTLQSLLVQAGAKPTDPVVLASDGRLMLPAWSTSGVRTTAGNPDISRVVGSYSWLPKPFEIIGSLGKERRQVYLDRNARTFAGPGWLVENKRLTANGGDHLLQFVDSTRREAQRLENGEWIVRLMGSAARRSD